MITHHGLQTTVALTAASLSAGTVAAGGLAAGGDLRALAPIGLGMSLLAASTGLVLAARMLAGAEGRLEHLAAQYEAARRDARTDPLTGLWNRRHFDERLAEAVIAALRDGEPFSVAIFDLDDFKAINDRYGHRAGDVALQHVAAILRAGTRELDVACRWGGEEFAVLLQRTPAPDAVRVANRVRHALAAGTVDTGAREVRLTASAGVSGFPSDGIDGPSVLEAADFALRRAKSLGKDRVERAWSSGSATTLVDLTGTDWAGISAAVPRARA